MNGEVIPALVCSVSPAPVSHPVTGATVSPPVISGIGGKNLLAEAAMKSDSWNNFNVALSSLEVCQATRDLGQEVPISVVAEMARDKECKVTILDGNSEMKVEPKQVLMDESGSRSHLYFDGGKNVFFLRYNELLSPIFVHIS